MRTSLLCIVPEGVYWCIEWLWGFTFGLEHLSVTVLVQKGYVCSGPEGICAGPEHVPKARLSRTEHTFWNRIDFLDQNIDQKLTGPEHGPKAFWVRTYFWTRMLNHCSDQP